MLIDSIVQRNARPPYWTSEVRVTLTSQI